MKPGKHCLFQLQGGLIEMNIFLQRLLYEVIHSSLFYTSWLANHEIYETTELYCNANLHTASTMVIDVNWESNLKTFRRVRDPDPYDFFFNLQYFYTTRMFWVIFMVTHFNYNILDGAKLVLAAVSDGVETGRRGRRPSWRDGTRSVQEVSLGNSYRANL